MERGSQGGRKRAETAGSSWMRRIWLAKRGEDMSGRGDSINKGSEGSVNEPCMERGGREGEGTRPASPSTPGHTEAKAHDWVVGLPRTRIVPVTLVGSPWAELIEPLALMSTYFALSFEKLHLPLLTSHLPSGAHGSLRPPLCLECLLKTLGSRGVALCRGKGTQTFLLNL